MKNNNVIQMHKDAPAPEQGDAYSNVEDLKAYQKAKSKTWAEIARLLECSPTKVSLYIKKNYDKGDVESFNTKVGNLLLTEAIYERYTPHAHGTVMTHQVKEVMYAIAFVQHRSIGLFLGEAGIGKTEGIKEFARQNYDSALFITMDPLKETKTAFVKHLYAQIPGNRHRRISCSEKLDEIILYFRKKRKTILIDEAHFLNLKALEVARSIQDMTGVGIVLSGTFVLGEELVQSAQLYSRIKVRRIIDPIVQEDDLRKILGMYTIRDAAIVEWLFARCNRIGRRYRWVISIIEAAHILCEQYSRVLSVEMLEDAERATGLNLDITTY